MKNETIKTYTEITVGQALKLATDGEHLCFTQNEGEGRKFWTDPSRLESIHPNRGEPFTSCRDGSYKYCATVTELDPCLSPDGCPELEPWMAYVGLGKDIPESNGEYYVRTCASGWGGSMDAQTSTANDGSIYAIDVRTAWAQEHFSEHCRIRNYQEPAKYGYFKGELIVAPEGWELVPEGEELASEIWYVTGHENAKFLVINRYETRSSQIAKLTGSVIGYFRNYQEPDPFRQFIEDEDLEWQGSAEYSLAKRAYNLGQQNPQPTK